MIKKDIYLTTVEEEIVEQLMEVFNITEQEARENVIAQKREAAYIYLMRGNIELHRELMKQLDEWTDDDEEEFIEKKRKLNKATKIFIMGGDNNV